MPLSKAWVARGAGLDVARFELAHVDKKFVYPGGDDYAGLFAHADVTEAIAPLQDEIPAWIDAAQRDVAGPMPEIAVGAQCTTPFPCEFFDFCAPETAAYPVYTSAHSTKLARRLRAEGYLDLRDVPPHCLEREDHQRIRRVTEPTAALILTRQPLGLSPCCRGRADHLDFETVGPVVPLWPGHVPDEEDPDAMVVSPPGRGRYVRGSAAVPGYEWGRSTCSSRSASPPPSLRRGRSSSTTPLSSAVCSCNWRRRFPNWRLCSKAWRGAFSTCCRSRASTTTTRR